MAHESIIAQLAGHWPAVRSALVAIFLLLGFSWLIRKSRSFLLSKVRSKKQMHNIKIFSTIITYAAVLIAMLLAIFSYAGSWAGFGVGVGFLTAALGWALQKPITGMAAWLMIVITKPFRIGDRIIIGGVRGDVVDIKLTHIYLAEIGGIVAGEENSSRIVMVPNSNLFDQNITNYTGESNYILDEVSFTVTHKSDLDSAKKLAIESAKKIAGEFIRITGQDPYIRTFFSQSGINVHVRYMSPAVNLQQYSSEVTAEIFRRIRADDDVELAVPHTKVLFGNDFSPRPAGA